GRGTGPPPGTTPPAGSLPPPPCLAPAALTPTPARPPATRAFAFPDLRSCLRVRPRAILPPIPERKAFAPLPGVISRATAREILPPARRIHPVRAAVQDRTPEWQD